MRRSSTTVSGPATVLLRRYGEKLLQNSNDSTRPSAPATIRMTPTVLRLNPEVVTSTAKVKIAPTTNRKILTPRLKAARLLQDAWTVDHSPSPTCTGHPKRFAPSGEVLGTPGHGSCCWTWMQTTAACTAPVVSTGEEVAVAPRPASCACRALRGPSSGCSLRALRCHPLRELGNALVADEDQGLVGEVVGVPDRVFGAKEPPHPLVRLPTEPAVALGRVRRGSRDDRRLVVVGLEVRRFVDPGRRRRHRRRADRFLLPRRPPIACGPPVIGAAACPR